MPADSVPPRPLGVPGTELLRSDHVDHRSVRQFRAEVIEGVDAGVAMSAAGERAVIGTANGVDLCLTDRSVSRFHCELEVVEHGILVRDLGSTNGTMAAGVRLVSGIVGHGSVITVGRTRVRIDIGHEHSRIELSGTERFGLLVGRSPEMRRVFAQLEAVAASDSTVLVLGETGTGKELAAESIHRESARAEGPFVVVDCGALPSALLESELFGHERGAFTGADQARAGAFQTASGGTVFLDEVGELGPDLQPKLLRVLERREVKRVGADRPVPVDVRVVAATNRDLRAMVNQQRFRADLYYRLAVVPITLPPLRDRAGDLSLLVDALLASLGKVSHPVAELVRSPDFLAELETHAWPGNVRELRNYVETCLALRGAMASSSPAVEAGDAAVEATVPFREARDHWVTRFERGYLVDLLRRHDGNLSSAARGAGIDRAYLYRLLWRHGLR